MDDKPTRTGTSWLVYLLGTLTAGAIVAAVLVVGPASGSQTGVTRTARAAEGVVQSTVSGSGNLQPASQLNLGFKTSGTITSVYVKQGQQVVAGQLLATLDPQAAEVTLEQSKAALLSAKADLAREEETNGEGSAQRSTSNGSGGSSGSGGSGQHSSGAGTKQPETKQPEESAKETEEISTATREANLASARATVSSDELTVKSDEQAIQDTKLYAPEDGTIVSLSGQVGEVVSASGTTKASAASSSDGSSASGSGAAGSGSGSAGRSGTGASASSSSSSSGSSGAGSSSSSAFAVLSDLTSMQLVAALSESEVGEVRPGQPATITVEALKGAKLAAHVSEVAILSTGGSGAVSYDVTFALDQMESGLKPGMSATAEVVVKQAQGVNVPTSAITGGSVTVIANGKQERRRVSTGLAGDSSTIVLSGLKAGEEVLLPALSTSSSSSGGITSRLGRLGGGGLGGGGLGGLAGGGPVLFRGGG